jgi:hypothetical protein
MYVLWIIALTSILLSPCDSGEGEEPIQDNDNYKPHAKHYSNLSMFTEVIA